MSLKQIKGFDNYLVSDKGYVINLETEAALRGNKKKTGYYEVAIKDNNGKYHDVLIHRIIAEAFCEKPEPEGLEVNHRDGDKSNNRADNLEWVTHGDNLKHAYENGLRKDDVSPKAVIAISMETGERVEFPSIYKAARFLGISQGNICMACKGERPHAGGYLWEYKNGAFM